MDVIKFGTDGWRAVIGDQFTFANLRRVATATAEWILQNADTSPSAVVGYDTRFEGEAFAAEAARVLADVGIKVYLADAFTSTPAVSWATRAWNCKMGVVITASHNPPKYSGFKLKGSFGGPASPTQVKEVEALIPDEGPSHVAGLEELVSSGMIEYRSISADYLDAVASIVDLDAIRKADIRIAYDAMFGSGQGMISELLGGDRVLELRHDHNPGFHGQAPEPIDRNLSALSRAVPEQGCDLGFATDGDADRIGLFDETGAFVDAGKIMALLVEYLHRHKGINGTIVKSFAASDLLDRMGETYGLPVETTKIGFKYIGPRMNEIDVVVGGEESGGVAAAGHIPERDGIYAGLLVVEMMAGTGKKLSELVKDLMDRFGPHYSYRRDLHISEELKQQFMAQLRSEGLSAVAGYSFDRTETIDGFKFRSGRQGWVMIRPSGTEPVLRVYSEAASPERAKALVDGVAARVGA